MSRTYDVEGSRPNKKERSLTVLFWYGVKDGGLRPPRLRRSEKAVPAFSLTFLAVANL